MVLIKRQSYPLSGQQKEQQHRSSLLPMGDEDSTSSSYSYSDYLSTPTGFSSPRNNSTFNTSSSSTWKQHQQTMMPQWLMPLYYAAVVLSWVGAFRHNNYISNTAQEVGMLHYAMSLQREETLRTLNDAKSSRTNTQKKIDKMRRTHQLFEHESRMRDEVYEMDLEEDDNLKKVKTSRATSLAMSWLQGRQEGLKFKYYHLQQYVQETSKQHVIEKYGPGPHRVHFRVRRPESDGSIEDFVIEMAPLDLVPHSIQVYLDMIAGGLWDNTVFYHHATTSHVIAAAPVVYGTFEPKHLHFQALGYSGVSFPEYSPSFPHEVYTVGFSGTGPNFYINGLDNTEHHGPGGQGHHALPGEADPCFAKVVSGHSVLKAIQNGPSTSTPQDELDAASPPVSWHDYDLTHIIQVEIL